MIFDCKNERCLCGLSKNEHNEDAFEKLSTDSINNDKKWSVENCTTDDELTDAFGEIKFNLYNENVASVGNFFLYYFNYFQY